jgi:hypothetical protein
MYRSILFSLTVAAMSFSAPGFAQELQQIRHGECLACRQYSAPWHGGYYNQSYGAPMALVVPPNAEMQTHMGWGVGGTRITPLCPQFGRSYAGVGTYDGRAFRATPPWPNDTDQQGVYYVRGPWR